MQPHVTAEFHNGRMVVFGCPDPNDESHNCDAMGCGSVGPHVLELLSPIEAAQELYQLRARVAEMEAAAAFKTSAEQVVIERREEDIEELHMRVRNLEGRLSIYEKDGFGVVPVAGGACYECYQDGELESVDTSEVGEESRRLRERVAALESPPVVPEGWRVKQDESGAWKLWLVHEGEDIPDSPCARLDRQCWVQALDGESMVAPWGALVALEYAHRTDQRPPHAGEVQDTSTLAAAPCAPDAAQVVKAEWWDRKRTTPADGYQCGWGVYSSESEARADAERDAAAEGKPTWWEHCKLFVEGDCLILEKTRHAVRPVAWQEEHEQLDLSGERQTYESKITELEAKVAALQALASGFESPAGDVFYSFDPETGLEEHDTAEEAAAAAGEAIDEYRFNAGDGWSEAVAQVQWGRLIPLGVAVEQRDDSPEGAVLAKERGVDYMCDYALAPQPDHLAVLRGQVVAQELALDAQASVVQCASLVVEAWEACDREADLPPESRSSVPMVRYIKAQSALRRAVASLAEPPPAAAGALLQAARRMLLAEAGCDRECAYAGETERRQEVLREMEAAAGALHRSLRPFLPAIDEELEREAETGYAKSSLDRAEQLQVELDVCAMAACGVLGRTIAKGELGWSTAYEKIVELRRLVEALKDEFYGRRVRRGEGGA